MSTEVVNELYLVLPKLQLGVQESELLCLRTVSHGFRRLRIKRLQTVETVHHKNRAATKPQAEAWGQLDGEPSPTAGGGFSTKQLSNGIREP